jgi:hypothetical protein
VVYIKEMVNTSNHNPKFKNPLEALRESSSEVGKAATNEIFRPMTEEFLNQVLGRKRKFSGEILPGESIEMKNVFTGKQTETDKLKAQIVIEKRLREEERVLIERKGGELKVQIEAIKREVVKLATATPKLSQEVEIASFQASSNVSIYELFFLQQLFLFIKSFREHIEDAHIWLGSVNARARKKNVWGENYKKHGAKYLLSGEHYSGRSSA